MEISTKVNLKMDKKMEEENMFGKMEISTMANGKMVKLMEEVK